MRENEISIEEFRKLQKAIPKPEKVKRVNKYGAEMTKYNDRTYHSKGEANYAKKLDFRKKIGEIKEIIPQYKIEININGIHICNWFVDFRVEFPNGKIEFHEYKGAETETFKIKHRLAKAMYPNYKFIVIKDKSNPWK
jgi:hypothetical protein